MDDRLFYLCLLLLLLIIGIALIIAFVAKHLKKKHLENTENNSIKISEIKRLNKSVIFYDLEPIILNRTCSSKHEFDRLDLTDFFIICISDNIEYYIEYMKKVYYNSIAYKKYIKRFNEIMVSDNSEIEEQYREYPYFKKYEERIFDSYKLHPVITANTLITKEYSSPQGRKYYYDSINPNDVQIIECIDEANTRINNAEIYKSTRNRERELVTPSLRYSIMKRDNFRCVLCGATSEDGAKLHVDHIIPVSKGGKTEISNLRTLCSTCNLGKSAKYDPYGPN